MKKYLRQNYLIIFFAVFVISYALILLISPALGPTDDFIFLRTLQVGKPILYYSASFPYYYYTATESGRFTPLAAMEYNLVGLFSKSPSVIWYYFIHAIQFVLLMILLVKILKQFTSNKFLIYLTPILLSLTPGFTMSWFRLQLNERNVIFFLAIFILCYLAYLKKPKIFYLVLGLTAVNIALYYRETTFIAIGAFALIHFLISWRTADKKINPHTITNTNTPDAKRNIDSFGVGVKIFDALLFLSSLIYIILYYLIVYLHENPNLIASTIVPYGSIVVFIKSLLNVAFFSDPVLIFILLPFVVWRLFKALFKHQKSHPLYDSMLITASLYIAGLFALNKAVDRYLLPAYLFALPPLFALLFHSDEQKKLIWKIIFVLVSLLLIFNVFPSGIHYLTFNKYLSVNFDKTLNFLTQDIKTNHPYQRANIFIDNSGRNGDKDIYFILGEFLQFKGLSSQQFDFKSNLETINPSFLTSSKTPEGSLPFSIFRTDKPDKISSGDYLIIEALTEKKNVDNEYLQSLNKDYKLIFQTKSPFSFPDLNLKTILKIFFSQRLSYEQKVKSAVFKGLTINENLMQSPDYYVFVRR